MRKILLLSFLLTTLFTRAQVICNTVDEGGTLTLTAPAGQVITNIEYASYGTPTGSCGSFSNGGCHAANSQSICEAVFIGQNSASIGANNAVFGDPCGGTFKRLSVQARYSSTLPLKLLSFSVQKSTNGKLRFVWTSAEEFNTASFIIERSSNGANYEPVGTVPAIGEGSHAYSFISNNTTAPLELYRLRMLDKDGKQQFSNILRVNNDNSVFSLSAYPNPASDLLTIVSSKQEILTVTSFTGQPITTVQLINGSQSLHIANWSKGIYLLKAGGSVVRVVKF